MDMIRTTADLKFQDFLRYPDIRVEEGEFAFVTGRSGAGKSTYLRLLNGSIPADPGCIFYRGIPLEEYQILPYRRQVLLVPQAVYLIPGTILDNFHFYYDVRRQQRIDGERAAEFLLRCCLDFPVDTSCDTLSGMMTGQILAGTLPMTSILYQIAIMIAICTAVTCACFGTLYFGSKTLYDKKRQIIQL